MASSTPSSSDSGRDELADLLRGFMESVAGISDRVPFAIDLRRLRLVVSVVALVVSIIFAWKILRAPADPQRRQRKRPGQLPGRSDASLLTSSMVQSAEACSSSSDSRVQDVVDDFFQPVKLTLGQLVRQKFCEGRKVTCRLLGVILEETSPEELQQHATVRSSVLEVLLEITKFCDLYLMERILDDESEERVTSALNDAGIVNSGGLVCDKDHLVSISGLRLDSFEEGINAVVMPTMQGRWTEKVLFCSTEKGRMSFVRQLEPDWHIDTNFEIISQLARFIKYQLHVSPTRSERSASNIFSSPTLEQFIGFPDHS